MYVRAPACLRVVIEHVKGGLGRPAGTFSVLAGLGFYLSLHAILGAYTLKHDALLVQVMDHASLLVRRGSKFWQRSCPDYRTAPLLAPGTRT